MSRRNKPRKSEAAMPIETNIEYKLVEVNDSSKLPTHYLGVGEGWQNRLNYWNDKLAKGEKLRIKQPITIYKFKRVVVTEELCLELEEIHGLEGR